MGERQAHRRGLDLAYYLGPLGAGRYTEVVDAITSGAVRSDDTYDRMNTAAASRGLVLPARRRDDRFLELSKGEFEGRRVGDVYSSEDLARKDIDWDFRHSTTGETAREAGGRVREAIIELATRQPPVTQDSDKIPGTLVIVHNLATSHALGLLHAGDRPAQLRAHMADNGDGHIMNVYADGGIYLGPRLLSAVGAVCQGCVAHQQG